MIKKLYRIFSVLMGIVILIAIYKLIFAKNDLNKTFEIISQLNISKILFSSFAFLISHLIRSLRLSLMIGRQDFSIINLIGKQYYTNAVNLIIPFKLGEVYRIIEFNKIFGNTQSTILTIIAERALDFLFLFVGLFSTLYFSNYQNVNLNFTIAVGILFIISVLITFFVIPENIKSFNLFLAKRNKKKWVIHVLATNDKIFHTISAIKNILMEKPITIITLTCAVWAFEILGLLFLFEYLDTSHYLLLAFFVFLSGLIPSASLGVGGLQAAFYLIYLETPTFPYLQLSIIYQLCVFLPAIIIGFGWFIILKLNFLKFHSDTN